jgi:hypothetical protein
MDIANRMIDSPMLGKFGAETVAQHKQQNRKNKSMATKLPLQPIKNAQDVKKQKAAPSQAQIAQLAYEIWISTGKQAGRDQQNWLEAEWQLRQM